MPRVELGTLKPPKRPIYEKKTKKEQFKTHGFSKNGKDADSRRHFQAIGFEWLKTPLAYRTQKEPHYNYGYS